MTDDIVIFLFYIISLYIYIYIYIDTHKHVFRICVEYIIQPYKTSENFNLSNQ